MEGNLTAPQVLAAIVAAVTSVVITVVGWIVVYRLTAKRDQQTRAHELRVKHLERQIQEFYGPLHSLVEQVMLTNDVQEQLLDPDAGTKLNKEKSSDVREYFRNRYFTPLHDEIALILRTKLYLVEGISLPDSFYNYLAHATQERLQAALWRDQQVDTSHIQGRDWDPDFPEAIKTHLDRLMNEYEALTSTARAMHTDQTSAQEGRPSRTPDSEEPQP